MNKYVLEKLNLSETTLKEWMDLFKTCFNVRFEYTDEWSFWYNNSSYKKSEIYVIKDKNKIVASYGLFPLSIIYKNQSYQAYLANNGMTHPKYGGYGFFTQLGKYIMSNIRTSGVILMGIPNDKAIHGHRKVGWQEMDNIPFFKNISITQHATKNTYISIDKFLIEDDACVKQFLSKYEFYIDKDSDYLNWRFVDRPNINYLIFKSIPFNSYVVLKHFKHHSENKLHIVDFGYNNIEDFEDLIKLSLNKGYDLGVDSVDMWCYNKIEKTFLKSYNFNEDSTSNRLILHSDIDFLKINTDNWHITLGDNDVF